VSSSRWLTVPNVITLGRLLLVPVFVALHQLGRPGWALACFIFAAVSDGVDGFLARVLDQRSKLGGILDPIADKTLVSAALITLVLERQLPVWLLVLIAIRDAWMAVGALIVRHKRLEIPTSPSRIGKYATFGLVSLIVLALIDETVADSALLHAYTVVTGFISGLCVVISTLQYFARFGYLLFAPPGSPPRVET